MLVKYKPRVVLRPHDQLGLYGALAERRTDWKEAFVAQGGAKQLAKIMAKVQSSLEAAQVVLLTAFTR